MDVDQPDVFLRLTELFRDVFDRPDLVLTREMSADQVKGWDSLMNVRLMVAAEMTFGVRFDTAEINALHNVGDLVELIAGKIAP